MRRVLLSSLAASAIICGQAFAIPTATLEVWLNADSLAGANGSPVALWTDDHTTEGGTGADDAALCCGGGSPTLQTAVPIFNGHNAVRFISTTALRNTTIASMNDFTLFMVYRWNSLDVGNQDWVFTFGSFDHEFGIGNNPGHLAIYDTTYQQYPTILQNANELYRLTYERNETTDANTLTLADGPTATNTFTSTATPAADFSLNSQGGGQLDGTSNIDIAELIIYRSLLSAADRAEVEAYLTAKYVPEPASALLAILGALLLVRCRRHRSA